MNAQTERLAEISAALKKAHEVCAGIVKTGGSGKIGTLASHANSATWQLSNAMKKVEEIAAYDASRASRETGDAPTPLPIDSAPRDGTMVRLLVQFTDYALEDTGDPMWTIGANGLYGGDDLWCFAGWDWEQDCFTAGEGTPVGWLPFHPASTPAPQGRVVAGHVWGSDEHGYPRTISSSAPANAKAGNDGVVSGEELDAAIARGDGWRDRFNADTDLIASQNREIERVRNELLRVSMLETVNREECRRQQELLIAARDVLRAILAHELDFSDPLASLKPEAWKVLEAIYVLYPSSVKAAPAPVAQHKPKGSATTPEIDRMMYAQGFTGTPGTGRFG